MTRYIISITMLALACLAYLILAFGARFNRTDELTSDGQPEGAVSNGVEGQGHTHFGGSSK